ncbi:MAG: hypothetical protein N4A50_06675 [Vallitalea sp.]|jgi:hypothetical protein|nr:hypothetical protein [Vallitalea sp.]
MPNYHLYYYAEVPEEKEIKPTTSNTSQLEAMELELNSIIEDIETNPQNIERYDIKSIFKEMHLNYLRDNLIQIYTIANH